MQTAIVRISAIILYSPRRASKAVNNDSPCAYDMNATMLKNIYRQLTDIDVPASKSHTCPMLSASERVQLHTS